MVTSKIMFAMFCWGLPFPDNVVWQYNIKQSSQNQCNQYSFGNTRRKMVIRLSSFQFFKLTKTQVKWLWKIIDVYNNIDVLNSLSLVTWGQDQETLLLFRCHSEGKVTFQATWTSSAFLLQAVLLVYDVTNQNSFDNLEDWYETVKKLCDKDGSRLPHIALVANKSKLYLKKKKQLYVPSWKQIRGHKTLFCSWSLLMFVF